MDTIDELFRSVEHTGRIGSFDSDRVADALEYEGFLGAGPELGNVFAEGGEEWIVLDREKNALVAAELCDGFTQMLCGILLAWSGVRRELDARHSKRSERSGDNDQREKQCAHELVRNLRCGCFAGGLAYDVRDLAEDDRLVGLVRQIDARLAGESAGKFLLRHLEGIDERSFEVRRVRQRE